MTTETLAPRRNILGPVLWTVQALLALFFVYAAYMKMATPPDELAKQMPWTAEHPLLLTITAWADLLGGLGILLPSLTRIRPSLTPLAGIGILLLQAAAIVFHVSRGEAAVVPLNGVLVALTVLVLWGRGKALPIASR